MKKEPFWSEQSRPISPAIFSYHISKTMQKILTVKFSCKKEKVGRSFGQKLGLILSLPATPCSRRCPRCRAPPWTPTTPSQQTTWWAPPYRRPCELYNKWKQSLVDKFPQFQAINAASQLPPPRDGWVDVPGARLDVLLDGQHVRRGHDPVHGRLPRVCHT